MIKYLNDTFSRFDSILDCDRREKRTDIMWQ